MDRSIFFAGELPRSSDVLFGQRAAMVGLGWLAQTVLGTSPVVEGLTVGPNSPAGLSVVVAPGSIYTLATIDASAYGGLDADTTHSILKQGIALDGTVVAITPPGTAGFSQVFLIQAQFQETDAEPVTLPYYNASNPSVPWSGPGNSGTPQNTRRLDKVVIQSKAGTAATTGSQTTPSPDAGWTALAAVTVANGATTITSGNIVDQGPRRSDVKQPDLVPLFPGLAAAGRSIGTSGYMKLPGGLMLQWGYFAPPNNSSQQWTITLPIAFPNALFSVVTQLNNTTAATGAVAVYSPSTTNFSIFESWTGGQTGNYNVFWMAIGN